MPLSRPIGRPHLTTPEGVQFTMADRSKLIRCVVTASALRKLARREIGMDDYEPIFLAHREEIERIAGRKYDATRALYMPFQIIPSDVVRYRTRS
jgi:hypothetical protein